MNKIIPHLWFDSNAEEAVEFYISVFKDSSVVSTANYLSNAEISGKEEGSVMTISFRLKGQDFMALNGGPAFKFNEAISLMIMCDNQEEIDYYWEKLSAVPEFEQCGWIKDKYGVTWQIVPKELDTLISGPNKEKSDRVMKELLNMKKIDIEKLKEVYNQE